MQRRSDANSSKLKRAAIAAGLVVVVAVAIMFSISTREAIPDRARFVINTNEQYVVPEPVPGQYIFHPLPDAGDEVLAKFDGSITWGELRKKECPYHDFGLPETEEWNRFVFYGAEVSLFQSLFFPPSSRWDEEGRWRY